MFIKIKKSFALFLILALLMSSHNAMATTTTISSSQSSPQPVNSGDSVIIANGGNILSSNPTDDGISGTSANNVTVTVENGGEVASDGYGNNDIGGKAIDLGNYANITVANGGTVFNYGQDPSGDGGIEGSAIYVGSNATINVSGLVKTDDNGGASGGGYNHWSADIYAGAGANITVNSGGVVWDNAYGGPAIQLFGGDATVVNHGTIEQTFDSQALNVSGNNNTITNNATIENTSVSDVIAFVTSGATGNVVNLYGPSAVTGYLSNYGAVGGATINLGFDGTNVVASTNDTITGNIGSSGNAWNAHAYGGTSTISGSSAFNNLQIDSGAILDTHAITVSGILNNSGNLNVTGLYTQSSGSTLSVALNSATSFGKITTSQVAAISSGSTLNLDVGGYITNGTTFDLVNTGGAGIGSLPGTISTNSGFFNFTDSSSSGNLVVTANRNSTTFNSVGTNPNSKTVGSVLDNLSNPNSGMSTVLGALEASSTTQAANSLNSMYPALNNGIPQVGKASMDQFVDETFSHPETNVTGISTGSEMSKGITVWAEGLGGRQYQDPQGSSKGYTASLWGTILGFEKEISDFIKLGFAEGFGNDQIKNQDYTDTTDVDSYQSTLYAVFQKASYYIDSSLSFAYNSYSNLRDINLNVAENAASAKLDGQQYSTYIESGYNIDVQNLRVTPLASFEYMDMYLPGYTENGAGALDLNVDSQNYSFAQTGLGFKVGYSSLTMDGLNVLPELKFKWLHDWVGDNQQSTATFVGGGSSFNTVAFTPDKSTYDLGAKITFYTKGDVTVSFDYDFDVRRDFQSNSGALEVKYSF